MQLSKRLKAEHVQKQPMTKCLRSHSQHGNFRSPTMWLYICVYEVAVSAREATLKGAHRNIEDDWPDKPWSGKLFESKQELATLAGSTEYHWTIEGWVSPRMRLSASSRCLSHSQWCAAFECHNLSLESELSCHWCLCTLMLQLQQCFALAQLFLQSRRTISYSCSRIFKKAQIRSTATPLQNQMKLSWYIPARDPTQRCDQEIPG